MATITCTACGGTGILNSADCSTCSGTGIVDVDITDISPDSITGDSNVDVDTSDYSAFLFVPNNDGKSSTTPGALFRLGSYCEIEAEAKTQDDANTLYPEQFVSSAASSTKAYEDAAGSTDKKGGILLSCDGNLLVKACEKTFLRSDDEIKIESGKQIVIRSGREDDADSRDITLNANNGDINEKCATSTKEHFGHDIALTEGDSITYTKGHTVGFTEGTKTFVTYGSQHFANFGSAVSISAAFTLDITIAIGLAMSFSLKLYIGNFDVSYTIFKFEKSKSKFNNDDTSVDDKILDLSKALVTVENKSVDLANKNLSLMKSKLETVERDIALNKRNIDINKSGISMNKTDLMHLIF